MSRNTKTYKGKYQVINEEKYVGKDKTITYRSSWELHLFDLLDKHPNIVSWGSEVLSIKYQHPLTGTTKSYLPDLYIQYVDAQGRKHTEIVEVKPYCQTNPRFAKSKYDQEQVVINDAKWKYARAFCKKNGIGFRVITEKDIFGKNKYNSKSGSYKKRRK